MTDTKTTSDRRHGVFVHVLGLTMVAIAVQFTAPAFGLPAWAEHAATGTAVLGLVAAAVLLYLIGPAPRDDQS